MRCYLLVVCNLCGQSFAGFLQVKWYYSIICNRMPYIDRPAREGGQEISWVRVVDCRGRKITSGYNVVAV